MCTIRVHVKFIKGKTPYTASFPSLFSLYSVTLQNRSMIFLRNMRFFPIQFLSKKNVYYQAYPVFFFMSASTFYKNIIFFTSGHALRCKIKPELFNHVCLWSEKKVINYIILLLKDSSIYSVNTSLDFTFQDYPGKAFRFVATYFLLSYTYNSRFLFFTMNKDNYPMITNSLIHSSMNWAEREAWDMFGCYFEGNDFMVRILNDYGFKGFPLRKDFPMTGFLEYWYSFDSKGVVKYPVKLMQEYRKFKLSFIWSADSRKEIMSFM